MIRKLSAVLVVSAFAVGSAFAADKACCDKEHGAKQASNKGECVSFASLKLSADQKSKLEAMQADCMKAGCTKESHEKFLKEAKTVLSKDQYSALKKECGSAHKGKVS